MLFYHFAPVVSFLFFFHELGSVGFDTRSGRPPRKSRVVFPGIFVLGEKIWVNFQSGKVPMGHLIS